MTAVAIRYKQKTMDNEIQNSALGALERGNRKKALTIIMNAYGSGIYGYCCTMLKDTALAEDIHQEIFVSAYKSLDNYGGYSTLRTWLYGIAHHRCLDALRKIKRQKEIFLGDEDPENEQTSSRHPDGHCEQKQIIKLMTECIQKLSDKVKNAVLLRYMKEFSYQEMEQICAESAATLQARVSRALPVLRRCIEVKGGKL